MTFQTSLDRYFPNSVHEGDFIGRTASILATYGFARENTIACVDVCRDEITRPLVDALQRVWGNTFDFSGLGGMLFAGKTGFLAAEHHAPDLAGRERYVFFAFPHIALGMLGEPGVCNRRGQVGPSGACGALMAFLKEVSTDKPSLELDRNDVEQSLLRQRLYPLVAAQASLDLVSLTRIAQAAIQEDFERMIGLTVKPEHADYALVSGIQVHGPGANYIWPAALVVSVNGKQQALRFSAF